MIWGRRALVHLPMGKVFFCSSKKEVQHATANCKGTRWNGIPKLWVWLAWWGLWPWYLGCSAKFHLPFWWAKKQCFQQELMGFFEVPLSYDAWVSLQTVSELSYTKGRYARLSHFCVLQMSWRPSRLKRSKSAVTQEYILREFSTYEIVDI